MLPLLLFSVPLLVGTVYSAPSFSTLSQDYNGYKVFRISSANPSDVGDIVSRLSLSTWKNTASTLGFTDIVVPPAQLQEFQDSTAGLDTIVMHEDLGASIAEETKYNIYAAGAVDSSWFDSYHSYADHIQFLNDLQSSFPANSEIITAGTSVQGRAITGIHFWGSSGKGKKPAIVLHSTVHAREWITTMVNEFVAYSLITNYTSNAEIKSYVDKYDFHIFPVVNPDGFVYTQTNDRLWRKNRQTASGSSCLGRDINRNWPYVWTGSGSSTNPCDETYRGQAAGDSPENLGLRNYLNNLAAQSPGVKLYIDWHSYSQLWMTPYGYDCQKIVANNAEYQSLVTGAATAIRNVYGTVFDTGPICSTIYQVAGGSVDYVADVTKAQYSLTAELRDTGRNGFVLPPAQIRPSGIETFEGFKYLLKNMK